MNDDVFTPALWLFGIAAGTLLSFLELLWLKRPFRFGGSRSGLLLLSLVNTSFIYLLVAIQNSYYLLFIFPLPVIPIAYILLKMLSYYAVQRITRSPVRSPWRAASLSMFVHTALFLFAYSAFARINPTRFNLEDAIRDKNNGLLEVMLWMSVKAEPNMTRLVNDAIQDKNDDAVRRLIRRGADPRQDYWLRYASHETAWRITKWRLDQRLTPEEFASLRQSPSVEDIAVGYGTAELEYCLQHGFEPKRYPGVIQAALNEHPLRERGVIRPDEIQSMKDKIVLLLSHGADINGKDEMLFPPIFTLLLLNLDLSPVLTLMIEKGADVNIRSPNKLYPSNSEELPPGLTPLTVAVIRKQPQYAAILIKSGADKTIKDDRGFTALDYARKLKADDAMLRLLQ